MMSIMSGFSFTPIIYLYAHSLLFLSLFTSLTCLYLWPSTIKLINRLYPCLSSASGPG
jgi:hypothetical protein